MSVSCSNYISWLTNQIKKKMFVFIDKSNENNESIKIMCVKFYYRNYILVPKTEFSLNYEKEKNYY